jgi:hypothetical protein
MTAPAPASAEVALCTSPNELIVIGCLGVLFAYRLVRLKRRGLEAIETAAQHAESGQLRAAAALLVGPACAGGTVGPHAQAALANLYLRRGQFCRAVWVLSSLTSTSSRIGRALQCSLDHSLAYVFAAGGALEIADRHWSVRARLRDPMSPLACLLLCKRGQFGELVALASNAGLVPSIDAPVDSAFAWHGERVVALLCAFAHAQDESQSATLGCRAREFLEAARPTYEGEYDYLQAEWLELRSFVEGQGRRLQVKRSHRVRASIPRVRVKVKGNIFV